MRAGARNVRGRRTFLNKGRPLSKFISILRNSGRDLTSPSPSVIPSLLCLLIRLRFSTHRAVGICARADMSREVDADARVCIPLPIPRPPPRRVVPMPLSYLGSYFHMMRTVSLSLFLHILMYRSGHRTRSDDWSDSATKLKMWVRAPLLITCSESVSTTANKIVPHPHPPTKLRLRGNYINLGGAGCGIERVPANVHCTGW